MTREELLEYIQQLRDEIGYLKEAFRSQLDKKLKRMPKGAKVCVQCGRFVPRNSECKVCHNTLWGSMLSPEAIVLSQLDRDRIDQEIANVTEFGH